MSSQKSTNLQKMVPGKTPNFVEMSARSRRYYKRSESRRIRTQNKRHTASLNEDMWTYCERGDVRKLY